MRLMLIISFVLSFSSRAVAADRPEIDSDALSEKLKSESPPLLLDVRTEGEFNKGFIVGAVLIPHGKVRERIAELGIDMDREIVVYCQTGRRAASVEKMLRKRGFRDVRHLAGDWPKWLAEERPPGRPEPAQQAP